MPLEYSKPFRCMHVIHSLGYGGAERIVCYYAKFHDRAEFVPEVATFIPCGPMIEQIESTGVDVHVLGTRSSDPRSILRLYGLFKGSRPAVVHFHNPLPVFAGFPAASLAGVPARVLTEHSVDYPGRTGGGLSTAIYGRLRSRMDAVIACSERVRSSHGAKIDPDRLFTIRNGVDTDRFSPQEAKGSAGSEGVGSDPVIASVGSLTPQKGYAYLIDAVSVLRSRGVRAKLRIAGEGPLRAELEDNVRRAGLEEAVSLHGELQDVSGFLAEADIVAGASLREGLPLWALEAMAMGKPVVATDAGGSAEAVEDGVTGILVKPGDSAGLARAIESLTGDLDLRTSMGKAARKRVESDFSARGMVRRTEEVYGELLHGRAGRKSESEVADE